MSLSLSAVLVWVVLQGGHSRSAILAEAGNGGAHPNVPGFDNGEHTGPLRSQQSGPCHLCMTLDI